MLRFPRLKSGVFAQHPFEARYASPIQVFTFLDGKEQRFPVRRHTREWRIELDQLDDSEAAEIESFLRAHLLTLEPFEFVDPVTGRIYGPCRVSSRSVEAISSGPGRHKAAFVVVEEGA